MLIVLVTKSVEITTIRDTASSPTHRLRRHSNTVPVAPSGYGTLQNTLSYSRNGILNTRKEIRLPCSILDQVKKGIFYYEIPRRHSLRNLTVTYILFGYLKRDAFYFHENIQDSSL